MTYEVTFLPEGRKVSVRPGMTVLGAARQARIGIRSRCGGKAGCLMCKVDVASGGGTAGDGLSPAGLLEKRKLAGLDSSRTRLACQAKVTGNAVISVPEDPLKAAVRRQLEKAEQDEDDLGW
ncbi:2Fe-2S iron-sulfur cluster-binding protein [Paenibacillus beijingensis]|uniref:Ferredoxin n=1 Tax=Paenibacillus beijingensis TaxID=1126833 RepID=A0A0D5NQC8_9BACL|nr:2Fe-2S iron-sulfur cluster-binding protein [Paenibacillus beijingensis]AJY77182.1 ferredoxin [Paenibacillus beijingensis]